MILVCNKGVSLHVMQGNYIFSLVFTFTQLWQHNISLLMCTQELPNMAFSWLQTLLVFAGPVRWTGKKTEIGLNPTAKDRTTGCGCTNSEFFRLPVAMFVEKSKNQKKLDL